MSLCEVCGEGQTKMCEYFKEHFLENGTAVHSCPKFWYDGDDDVERMDVRRSGKVQILTCRSLRKAMAGERVMMITSYKAAQAERLLNVIADSDLKEQVASVHVCFKGGGEIWIGGT